MKFRTYLAYTALAMAPLTWTLEPNESSLQFLKIPHSTDCWTRLNLIDTVNCYSQASQDKFVYLILYGLLGKQDEGCYLEIGAGDPIHINNSYFFEKHLKWSGVSIDNSKNIVEKWRGVRTNPILHEDAVKADYDNILQSFPKFIDYLSLDIDGYYTDVLKRLPFGNHTFKVITIEHDFYRFGDLYRREERQILKSLGYYLLCSDVSLDGRSFFEDWWIHPSFFSSSQFSAITSLDLKAKNHTKLIQTLRVALSADR